jgi:hypothetical protein
MGTQVPGKQLATLRFEVFTCGPILGRSGHYLVLHMSKNWGGYHLAKNHASPPDGVSLTLTLDLQLYYCRPSKKPDSLSILRNFFPK